MSRLGLVAVIALALGCTATIGGPNDNSGSGSGSGAGSGSGNGGGSGPGTAPTANPDGTVVEGASVAQAPLRRLGKTEIEHTIGALLPGLPETLEQIELLPNDNEIQLGFSLPGTVSDIEVKRFMDLAEIAIETLGASAPSATFDCLGQDEPTCARAFVVGFGKRAFRRPLDAVEVEDLLALYEKLRTDPEMAYDFRGALGVLVEAMLQSPGFIYRWERGLAAPELDGDLIKFDDYEMASRLSYFIWNSMPDEALLAAADAGELRTPDQIAAQAQRLLDDPRADETFGDFVAQWLELGPLEGIVKDENTYPDFQPALRASMRAEAVSFARDVLRGASPTFTSLLTAPYTFVDAPLATYYGLTPDASGRVDLTNTPRVGLLTQAALMAVKGNSYRTSPVRRGKFILNRLFCSVVPPPPPNVVPELPAPDPNLTLREQLAVHRENTACAGCHNVMDQLGLAFEHFDGAGRYRETDGVLPIDATGSATIEGVTLDFDGAADLSAQLAQNPEAYACFARQWLRYAIDRFEQDVDRAATDYLVSAYQSSGLDTRALIVDITRTLPFSHRAPAEGEVLTP